MEFNILYYLALHPGWTFTREQLYQYAMPININAIQTVHGYGYRFEK